MCIKYFLLNFSALSCFLIPVDADKLPSRSIIGFEEQSPELEEPEMDTVFAAVMQEPTDSPERDSPAESFTFSSSSFSSLTVCVDVRMSGVNTETHTPHHITLEKLEHFIDFGNRLLLGL